MNKRAEGPKKAEGPPEEEEKQEEKKAESPKDEAASDPSSSEGEEEDKEEDKEVKDGSDEEKEKEKKEEVPQKTEEELRAMCQEKIMAAKVEDLEERREVAEKRREKLAKEANAMVDEKEKAGTETGGDGKKETGTDTGGDGKEETGTEAGGERKEETDDVEIEELQSKLDPHTTPLWETVIVDIDEVKQGKREPLIPAMLSSQSLGGKYTMMREALHRPMTQLEDGFGLKVNLLKEEVDDYGNELKQSITTVREDLNDAEEKYEAKKSEIEELEEEMQKELEKKRDEPKECKADVKDAEASLQTVLATEKATRSFSEILRNTTVCLGEVVKSFPELLGRLFSQPDTEKEKRRLTLAAILRKATEKRESDLESETPKKVASSTEESKKRPVPKPMLKEHKDKLRKRQESEDKVRLLKEKREEQKKEEQKKQEMGQQKPSEPEGSPRKKKDEDLEKVNDVAYERV